MTADVVRPNRSRAVIALGILLLGCALVSVRVGPFPITLTDIFNAFSTDMAGSREALVIRELRLPRLMLAALVGAALAMSGAVLQGLFRNPLADPGLIGVSSGAALAAVSVIVLGGSAFSTMGYVMPSFMLPAGAFIGALLASMMVWRIASRHDGTDVALLLLAGIAINSIAMAVTGLLVFMADDAQLRTLTFWNMRSLAQASWGDVLIALPCLMAVFFVTPWIARPLNALLLGEAVAGHLGFSPQRVKQIAVVSVALAVGAAVSVSGLIGFVGLVAPHLVRLLLGVDHRVLLPASALLGALLLVLADMFARTVVAPAELPIGIVMALIGGPFFLLLLMQRRRGI
ncbi:MAG: iron ABC transporter [Gammaproteobacteria bacterium HGW-Gammaproteobacteria-14]|nr:MAG: iron ABC transporter [Gammaproteobacteria bacterium HGW-Gammaproteobacteria-14]